MPASSYSASDPVQYLETRVDFKTEAYRRKGERYRWSYLITSTTAAIAAATVPVLINLDVPKIAPTLLSLLVTVLVSVEGIFHLREHWRSYDLMKSFLRQEACLFQAKGGVYRNKAADEAFVLLVERVEDGIAKERAQTIEMRTARNNDQGSSSNSGGTPSEGKPTPTDT